MNESQKNPATCEDEAHLTSHTQQAEDLGLTLEDVKQTTVLKSKNGNGWRPEGGWVLFSYSSCTLYAL